MTYKPRCKCSLTLVDGKCPDGCERFRRPKVKTKEQYERERVLGERIGIEAGRETWKGARCG